MRKVTLFLILGVFTMLGERGSAQESGLSRLTSGEIEGPVIVVDLVKFKPGGEAQYNNYDDNADKALASIGAEVVFRGNAIDIEGQPENEWDRVTFRKYPSAGKVLEMAQSPIYAKGIPDRMVAVAKNIVYAFSGELPRFNDEEPAQYHPMKVIEKPDSEETVFMLNLLRFKPDGGREQYFTQYAVKMQTLMQSSHGGPVMLLKGVTPVFAEEEIDQLILIQYPSMMLFRDMVYGPEYKEVAHLRTDAIELGGLHAFKFREKPAKDER